jgi:16S rRNA G966 N2-methylase RsmD
MTTKTPRPGERSVPPGNRRTGYGSEDAAGETLAGEAGPEGYELLDAGHGERLERWGPYRLRRPDPRAAGLMRQRPAREWEAVDARYHGDAGHGSWTRETAVPDQWVVKHDGLALVIKLAPFKHTGLFPEQAVHWRWMRSAAARATKAAPVPGAGAAATATSPVASRIRAGATSGSREEATDRERAGARADAAAHAGNQPADESVADAGGSDVGEATGRRGLRVLNLFAYTGGATIALARDGHLVTHVDASKPALAWARENARINELPADAIRWIQDDVPTFVARERRRGRRYDAVLLDPPAFGRAPKGAAREHAIWRVENDLLPLLENVLALLADPVFILINDYARDAAPGALDLLLRPLLRARGWLPPRTGDIDESDDAGPDGGGPDGGRLDSGGLDTGRLSLSTRDGQLLDTGAYARWSKPPAR